MAEATAYQFRVALRQISPKIWRRVQLLSAQSLADLHFSIQVAMGWTDEFQHRFTIRNHRRGERFAYEYNFHDAWEMEVLFEGAITLDPAQALAILRRQPPASFDRAEVNRQMQRYTREGHPPVSGDIE